MNISGKESQSVLFECKISKEKWKKTGHDVMVKWLKRDREIKESNKYSFIKNGNCFVLKIKNIGFEDEAEYSAIVIDDKTAAKLIVEGNLRL